MSAGLFSPAPPLNYTDLVDVVVTGSGTIYLFALNTAASREWVEANVSDDRQFLGRRLAVEHRFVHRLIHGMEADGLVVDTSEL